MDSNLKKKLNAIIQYQNDVRLKPYAFLEQVSYLIVLKLIDEERGEKGVESTLVKDEEIFYDQADRFRWSNWINKGWKLVDFLRYDVIPYMASIESSDQIINGIFNNAELQIESDETVLNIVSIISTIDFDSLKYEDRVEFYDYLVDKLLKEKDYELDQYWTPRNLSRLIISLLNPQPDDKIFDPACGSGGLITEYIDYLYRNGFNIERSFQNLTGIDISRSMVRLTLVSLLLRGVNTANIFRADFLKRGEGLRENILSEKFDYVLTHPPFKGIIYPDEVREDIEFKSKRTDILYLEAVRTYLADGGLAAVITPNSILYALMRDYREMKKRLIENNELLAIISLPEGMFDPHTSVSANLLILYKGNSHNRNKVWFYDFNQKRNSNQSLRKKSFDSQFNEVTELWARYRNSGYLVPPGPRANKYLDNSDNEPFFWWANYDQIYENDYDLSFNLYKPILSKELKTRAPLEIIEEIKEINEKINMELIDLESKVRGLE